MGLTRTTSPPFYPQILRKTPNRIAWRLSEILRLLQLNLFERRPLRELLGSGNESPPDRSSQLTMKFTWT